MRSGWLIGSRAVPTGLTVDPVRCRDTVGDIVLIGGECIDGWAWRLAWVLTIMADC